MNRIRNLSAALFFAVCGSANAGIPVADGIAIAQNIAMSMAEQLMHEALAQARDELTQKLAEEGFELDKELADRAEDFAWEMYAETTQKHGFGWNYEIGNSELYRHMETYTKEALKNKDARSHAEALAKYKELVDERYRSENGMESDQEHIQNSMDKDLQWKAMVDSTLAEVNARHESIEDLRERADNATTAQEKEDLQVAIAIEQNAIANENLRLQLAAEAQAIESKTERHRMNRDVRAKFEEIRYQD